MGDAGSYIFQGLANMGNAIGQRNQHAQMMQEAEEKRLKEESRTRKELITALDRSGIVPRAKGDLMGVDDLKGEMKALEIKAQVGEHTMRQEYERQRMAQIQNALAQQQAFQKAYGSNINQFEQGLTQRQPDVSPEQQRQAFMDAVGQSGDPKMIEKAIEMQGANGSNLGDPKFYSVPGMPGRQVVTRGNYTSTVGDVQDRTDMTDYQRAQVENGLWAVHDAANQRIAALTQASKTGQGDGTDYSALIAASKAQRDRALSQLKQLGAIKGEAAAGGGDDGANQFQDVAAAKKAGRKSGDKIMLWDAKQNKFRPFQID